MTTPQDWNAPWPNTAADEAFVNLGDPAILPIISYSTSIDFARGCA